MYARPKPLRSKVEILSWFSSDFSFFAEIRTLSRPLLSFSEDSTWFLWRSNLVRPAHGGGCHTLFQHATATCLLSRLSLVGSMLRSCLVVCMSTGMMKM
jgi:hypothetical protein